MLRLSNARTWIALLVLPYWFFCANAQATEVEEPFRVMILRNTSQYLPASILQDRGMREVFAAKDTRNVEFFVETIDTMWFARSEIEPEFLSLFRKKYGSRKIDLLMAAGADALDFALRFRQLLLPGVPIVFYNVSEDALRGRQLQAGMAGVVLQFNLPGTLELAVHLQPDARRIVVVNGASPYDKNWARRAREALRTYEGRLEVSYWTGQSLQQLLENLRKLPADSIVLYLAFSDDGAGRAYSPADIAKRVAAVSPAPVYGVLETYLGQGIVGGAFPSFEAHGKLAGELALRVLADENPENIGVQPSPQAVATIDWRQLQRWKISESKLPPGSVVRFRSPSMWEQYHWHIIGAFVIIAVQAGLIVGLLLHRARRRRAESRLRETQEIMDLAASAGELGLWMRDLAGGEIWANASLRALFGFHPDERLRASDMLNRIHPHDRAWVTLEVQRAQEGGLPFEGEFRTILPAGQERWVLMKGRTFNDAGGRGARRMGVVLDVTERKRAEEALRESEARFRNMADKAPVMIWMSGTDKLCTFFNKGWLDFTGRNLEQELGNGWAEGVHQADLDRCLEIFNESFDARKEFAMEYRLRRNDGEYRWILDKGVPRVEPDGTFIGYIGTCIDITERLSAQRDRAELAHLTRISTMGELAGSLAHELNQPLTAILSNAQAARRFLAADPADSGQLLEILDDIVDDDNRAGEVIRRMRSLFKKEEIEFDVIDLPSVIRDVMPLVNTDAVLHNIRLAVELPLRPVFVRGNKIQLQQVALNLLLNAFNAMNECPPTQRQVNVGIEVCNPPLVKVAVRDRGTGLRNDQLEKMFEPFFTTKPDGLGMGLSISRSIIEAHAGRLWAENNSDRGATFYFTLPMSEN